MFVFDWYALLHVLFSFAITLTRKRELVALLLLSYGCLATVNVMWLFLTVPWVGLQCVIVIFPGHTHSLKNDLGLDARKAVFGGLRTTYAQSDQRLCYSLIGKKHI